MSTSSLTKFPGGSQDKGLNIFEPDIGTDINWAEDTVNMTGGVRRGAGVRYGVAPLAGHSNTEVPAGTATNGIQRSEIASGAVGLTNRELIFGIVPLTISPYDGAYPKVNRQFYVYLVGLAVSGPGKTLDACIGATLESSVNKQAATFVAGLAQSSYREESPLARRHKTELLNLPVSTTPTAADMQSILALVLNNFWLSYAHISVSGKRIPYNWMIADVVTDGDATHSPAFNIWTAASAAGLTSTVYGGAPSEIITREAQDYDTRPIQIQCLDSNLYRIDMAYTANITKANTSSVQAYGTGAMYASVTATKSGASTAYSSVEGVIVNDPGSYTNSRHDAILLAGETPFAIIYQDWLEAVKGMMPRWIDLSSPGCMPRQGVTNSSAGSSNGIMASAFVGTTGYDRVTTTDGTGVLSLNKVYDIGFSYYNKLIDYETNVVYGAGVQTPDDGTNPERKYAVVIDDLAPNRENAFENMIIEDIRSIPWEGSPTSPYTSALPWPANPRGFSVNDYQVRFYYRESGTPEWLPAGTFDLAQFWFSVDWPTIDSRTGPMICLTPVAGLPGGQTDGFIDYTPLPKQRYICTTVFQQRAVWWSEKSMYFSPVNNIYAYPTRNIVTAPTGKWRGGIVHSQKDLSQQISRLVVFGDNAFSCRFTGSPTVQNVRISSTTVGQFAIDGSDFRMEYLCDSTAFSFRSACVGDGILYWWGPQGIYRDDGITPPVKISRILEPDIFSYVDMQLEKEVVSIFNKRTSEIIWFYPPKVADSTFPTYCLTYNAENDKFYPGKMRCKVDSVQNIKIENDDTPANVRGERILIHGRETTSSDVMQRTFYFDDVVEAGEQGPTREVTIVTVATPSVGQRRLTFAAGSISPTTGNIQVNDLICIQNAKGYAPTLTNATDMIAKVMAVSTSPDYVDILLPDGGALDGAASLTGQTAFPIYQRKPTAAGLHGITYRMSTNYWLPDGMSNSWYFIYLYFLFRYIGIPTPTNAFTGEPSGEQILLTYRSLVCAGAISDTLGLVNNSDGQCQIHHPMRNAGRAASGQALKYALSGIHIGNPWTLEYLEAHCEQEKGFTLKDFQG